VVKTGQRKDTSGQLLFYYIHKKIFLAYSHKWWWWVYSIILCMQNNGARLYGWILAWSNSCQKGCAPQWCYSNCCQMNATFLGWDAVHPLHSQNTSMIRDSQHYLPHRIYSTFPAS
jgi:hypothetical protein